MVLMMLTAVAYKWRRYKNFGDFKLPSPTSGDATIFHLLVAFGFVP
ncbi:MAG: hypothetical protein ACK4I8_12055 [Armatimonadota bacterium]